MLQLRIALEGVESAIWRRLLVPSGVPLARLSEIFRVAMGWTNSHLHAFTIGEQQYGMGDDDNDFPEGELDEDKFTVRAAIEDERQFRYEYDFGDGWEHQVVVEEEVITAPLELTSAVCLDGERSCPLEDCGGSHGYAHLLELVSDPGHEEHQAYMDRPTVEFDSEEFDPAITNVLLQNLR